jgi:predicted RNase H-like HicB family nuclease
MSNMQYAVIYEKTRTGYGAHAPDLPGCVAVGGTLAQTKKLMREAIALHLQGMHEDGLPTPRPTTLAEQIEVESAA